MVFESSGDGVVPVDDSGVSKASSSSEAPVTMVLQ
jgi:hypothetical protein